MNKKGMGIFLIILVIVVTFSMEKFANFEKARFHQHQSAQKENQNIENKEIFNTHLPVIKIDTKNQEITETGDEKPEVIGKMEIISKEKSHNYYDEALTMEVNTSIKIRGNSSKAFDKKQYLLKTLSENGENKAVPLLGMPKGDEWVLNGPYLDRSLIRNYMCYNISGEIMKYSPQVRFCEVFIDGDYRGLYLMIEKVKMDEQRVNLSPHVQGVNESSYIIERDRLKENETFIQNFTRYTNEADGFLGVIYPGKSKIDEETLKYIEDDISQFEKSVYSYDYDITNRGYTKYIDVDSFVDYFIINEFFQNFDAGIYSTFSYKDLRGKINMGPVWDFNSAMNNAAEDDIEIAFFNLYASPWYYMLMKDEAFVEKIIARYEVLRKSVLSEEYLLTYIDETVNYLGGGIDRNFQVWGYTFQENLLMPAERNSRTYEEEIEKMKTFIKERGEWMDKNIVLLRQFSHESKVKNYKGYK